MSRATGKEALLLWCKNNTVGYKNVNVTNFTTSWKDGLAFCALIHRFMGKSVLDFDSLDKSNAEYNLQLAFDVGDRNGIPALLDVEDMVSIPVPEMFSVITYLSQYYHRFSSSGSGKSGSGLGTISEPSGNAGAGASSGAPAAKTTAGSGGIQKPANWDAIEEQNKKKLQENQNKMDEWKKALQSKKEDEEKAKKNREEGDLKRKREEEEKKKKEEEEKAKKLKEEQEKKKRDEEERLRKQREEEEKKRKMKEEEDKAKKLREEQELKKKKEEEEKLRRMELERKESFLREEQARKQKEEEEKAKKLREEQELKKKKEEEERARKLKEEQELKKKKEDEERSKKMELERKESFLREEQARKQKEEGEKAQKLKEEQELKKKEEERVKKMELERKESFLREEQAKRQREEEEKAKKLREDQKKKEEEEKARKLKEEEESKKKKEEEERLRKLEVEKKESLAREEVARKQKEEEEKARKLKEEQNRKQTEEVARRQKEEEEKRSAEAKRLEEEKAKKAEENRRKASTVVKPNLYCPSCKITASGGKYCKKCGGTMVPEDSVSASQTTTRPPATSVTKRPETVNPVSKVEVKTPVEVVNRLPAVSVTSNNVTKSTNAPPPVPTKSTALNTKIEQEMKGFPLRSHADSVNASNPTAGPPPIPSKSKALNSKMEEDLTQRKDSNNAKPDSSWIKSEANVSSSSLDSNIPKSPETRRRQTVAKYLGKPPTMEGWLIQYQESNIFNRWKRRWCKIQEDTLVYWDNVQNRTVSGRDAPPKGSISLQHITDICPDLDSKDNEFTISTEEMKFKFRTNTTDEMFQWIDIIGKVSIYQQSMREINDDTIFGPKVYSKEGILKCKWIFGLWKDRWVTLKGGVLFFFSLDQNRKKGKASGKFALYNCVMSEYEGDSTGTSFQIQSKDGSVVMQAPSDQEMHMWLNTILRQQLEIQETINSIVI